MNQPQFAVGDKVRYWSDDSDRLNGDRHTGTVVSLIGVRPNRGAR